MLILVIAIIAIYSIWSITVRGCRVTTPPSPEIDSHGDIS